MPIGQPDANLLNAFAYDNSATALQTPAYAPHPGAVETIWFCLATTNGTLQVQAQMTTGTWASVLSSAATVTADQLTTVVIPVRARNMRALFTPAASAGTVTIDVSTGGWI